MIKQSLDQLRDWSSDHHPENKSAWGCTWMCWVEFLTKKTTFTNGLSKKTTCKKNCQKRPPLGGGMSSQLIRGTCRHCQSRHVLAVWNRAGMLSNMGHAA
jgi:hypothetical protein